MRIEEMVCILCPRGCHLTVTQDGDDIQVTGHTCPRGKQYGINELTHPMRTVTTSVYVEDPGRDKMLSVKTSQAVPKEKIEEVLSIVKTVKAKTPVKVGDVLVAGIAGTEADLVATRNIE